MNPQVMPELCHQIATHNEALKQCNQDIVKCAVSEIFIHENRLKSGRIVSVIEYTKTCMDYITLQCYYNSGTIFSYWTTIAG
jgi:hypothetical protein